MLHEMGLDELNGILCAAAQGDSAYVRVLVEMGVDSNTTDPWGRTPVWIAARGGHTETVHTLLDLATDPVRAVNARDELGQTPVWVAARGGHTETVRTLVEYGADINEPDIEGQTPIMSAVLRGDTATARAGGMRRSLSQPPHCCSRRQQRPHMDAGEAFQRRSRLCRSRRKAGP
jgi:ankyrin repeat protein